MKISRWIWKKSLFSISAWGKKLLCSLVVRYGTRINQFLVAALSWDYFVYIYSHIILIFMDLYWWEWCKMCANGHELNSIFGMLLTIMLHLWHFFRQQSWAAELEISIASASEKLFRIFDKRTREMSTNGCQNGYKKKKKSNALIQNECNWFSTLKMWSTYC